MLIEGVAGQSTEGNIWELRVKLEYETIKLAKCVA
jgi:hypothetical protein